MTDNERTDARPGICERCGWALAGHVEPSDAAVTAALEAFNRDARSYRERMRAALRAAEGAR